MAAGSDLGTCAPSQYLQGVEEAAEKMPSHLDHSGACVLRVVKTQVHMLGLPGTRYEALGSYPLEPFSLPVM